MTSCHSYRERPFHFLPQNSHISFPLKRLWFEICTLQNFVFNKWKIIFLYEKVYLTIWTAASEWKTPPNIETAFAQIFFFLSRFTDRYSYKNLYQKSFSESPPSINFKISTKHQHLDKTLTSKYWPNLGSESLPRFNFNNNLYKTLVARYVPTPASKSCLNFNFKILTKPCTQSLNKSLALWPKLSSQICNISNNNNLNEFWVGILTRQGHINEVY